MSKKSLDSTRATAQERLSQYTDPELHYSFATYDRQGDVDAPLTPADVLSANLLSLRLGWRQVIPLFAEGNGPEQELRSRLDEALVDLRQASAYESHATLDDLESSVASIAAANVATKHVKGWTAVTVSKVPHRRRPHIVPLIDSRVRNFYGARKPSAVRKVLWEDIRENEGWLSEIAESAKTSDGRPVTLLRLADTLIWMS